MKAAPQESFFVVGAFLQRPLIERGLVLRARAWLLGRKVVVAIGGLHMAVHLAEQSFAVGKGCVR